MELLRWVLQRILPYPCFLWDRIKVAARLRMTVQSFDASLDSGSELSNHLAAYEYTGLANQFLGRRWWRSGVESLLWEITDGRPFDLASLKKSLAERSAAEIEFTPQEDPLVCIDEEYRVMDQFFDINSAVRLMPDDWPSYADVPWTPIEIAKANPEIRAAVLEQDQEKLAEPPGEIDG